MQKYFGNCARLSGVSKRSVLANIKSFVVGTHLDLPFAVFGVKGYTFVPGRIAFVHADILAVLAAVG